MRQKAILVDTVKCRCGCGKSRKRFDSHGVERYYIRWHGYMTGRKHTAEAKQKMRLSKVGKKLTKQHCAAISRALIGNHRKRDYWAAIKKRK